MKRIQHNRYGGPEEMYLADFQPAAPAKGEILVAVKAASINPADWKIRQGKMKLMTGRKMPRAMGVDFSGVVLQTGSDVTDLRPGDPVVGSAPMKQSGAFAEQVVTPRKLVVAKPSTLSFEEAAALPTIGVTAWRALVKAGGIKAGSSVFLNGALGGVGKTAARIAKAMGATVTGRVGPDAAAEASALCDHVLDYTQPIPESLDGTFDIVFDCNGSLTVPDQNRLAKPDGIIIDINPTAGKFFRTLVSRHRKFVMAAPDQGILVSLIELISAGKLRIDIGRTAQLADAIPLIRELEAGHKASGKAVILMH